MGTPVFADTISEVTRVLGAPPPLIGAGVLDDALLSPAWENGAFDTHVPGMDHHIISATHRGVGGSVVKREGRTFEAPSRSGTIMINPRGSYGWWRSAGGPIISNLYLGARRLERAIEEIGVPVRMELVHRLHERDDTLYGLMRLIANEPHPEDTGSRLYVETLIDAVCLHLVRAHGSLPHQTGLGSRGLATWQVRKISDYMRANLDRPMTLEELAAQLQLSRFYFCRAFRQTTGFAPHQWLLRLRVRHARMLLADLSMPITQIALCVGYQTPSAFNVAFKRAVGVAPSVYRAQLQQ